MGGCLYYLLQKAFSFNLFCSSSIQVSAAYYIWCQRIFKISTFSSVLWIAKSFKFYAFATLQIDLRYTFLSLNDNAIRLGFCNRLQISIKNSRPYLNWEYKLISWIPENCSTISTVNGFVYNSKDRDWRWTPDQYKLLLLKASCFNNSLQTFSSGKENFFLFITSRHLEAIKRFKDT